MSSGVEETEIKRQLAGKRSHMIHTELSSSPDRVTLSTGNLERERGATGRNAPARFRFLYLTTLIVDKSTVLCRAELPLELQQPLPQLQKRAQQLRSS